METRLWTSPHVEEKVHIIFKLFMYYKYIGMFKATNYYVLWTVSMCTTSLQSEHCRIVLWYKCTRIIYMDGLYTTKYSALAATPGDGME